MTEEWYTLEMLVSRRIFRTKEKISFTYDMVHFISMLAYFLCI